MKKIEKTIIIAEAGVNHNGKLNLAKNLIDNAKFAGADFIKFQFFNPDNLTVKNSKLASYQKKNITKKISQYNLLKELSLSKKDFMELYKYSIKNKINFLASSFDIESCYFLNSLGLEYIKIPSGEINNIPYLEVLGRFKKKIILSTGLSKIKEIHTAIRTLIKAGTSKNNLIILHCNSEYPTPIEDVNMKAMITIKNKFGVNVGYSDHSNSIEVPIVAVSLGAKVIEKHLTLNKKMKGPDHKASINSKEFAQMVKNIRNTEVILGSEIKKPSQSEIKNIKFIRKSIVAKKVIKRGEKFSLKNLTIKRPGSGISPNNLKKIIGKKSNKNYFIDDLIQL